MISQISLGIEWNQNTQTCTILKPPTILVVICTHNHNQELLLHTIMCYLSLFQSMQAIGSLAKFGFYVFRIYDYFVHVQIVLPMQQLVPLYIILPKIILDNTSRAISLTVYRILLPELYFLLGT